MRLALTVVSPASRTSANLVLDADAEAGGGEVADELARFADGAVAPPLAAGGTGAGARVLQFPGSRTQAAAPGGRAATADGHAAVFVDGRPVNPRLTLAESPLREGCVVSIGDPRGCVPPEPTGVVEIRAAGGPAAGARARADVRAGRERPSPA